MWFFLNGKSYESQVNWLVGEIKKWYLSYRGDSNWLVLEKLKKKKKAGVEVIQICTKWLDVGGGWNDVSEETGAVEAKHREKEKKKNNWLKRATG